MDKDVKFFSKNDWQCGNNLVLAENVLNSFDSSKEYNDINEILEFYNIQKYLDNKCYLTKCNEETINQYLDISKRYSGIIGKYFSTVNEGNILELYKEIKGIYYDVFWELFDKYKMYERISEKKFEEILNKRLDLRFILIHKRIVYKYDSTITRIMMKNEQTCEILLDEYLTVKSEIRKYYFPNSLNKDELINKYLDSDKYNFNYVQLIIKSTSTQDLILSDKLRLKAKRKYEKEVDLLFSRGIHFTYGVKLSYSNEQEIPVDIKIENGNLCFTYSTTYLKENLDYPVLLIYNFIHIFMFVDNQIRFTHVHKINLMSVFIRFLGIKGKQEYIIDESFKQFDMAAQLQIQAYYRFLEKENLELEEVCEWFFKNYLDSEFNAKGFFFNPSSKNATYLEKNRNLNSEIDSILKQFRMWCEDKEIDTELLQISSSHMFFKDVPSLIDKKYIYSNSEEFDFAGYLLCSDQSNLHYISDEYHQNKFHDLIKMNNLKLDDFHEYQKTNVLWLIEHSYIYENDQGYLKNYEEIVWGVDEIYFNEVLSYNHLEENKQKVIDILLEKGALKYENSLFSKPEQDYLNYMFNMSEFSNGLDLRNKYLHGTQSLDENVHFNDYFIILRMLILCILKINDEFCLEYNIKEKT